jgi:hypothetical protein
MAKRDPFCVIGSINAGLEGEKDFKLNFENIAKTGA